jgi:hypothetical protein
MYKYECNGGRVRGRTLTLRLSELEPPDPESGPGGLSAESVQYGTGAGTMGRHRLGGVDAGAFACLFSSRACRVCVCGLVKGVLFVGRVPMRLRA